MTYSDRIHYLLASLLAVGLIAVVGLLSVEAAPQREAAWPARGDIVVSSH